MISVKGSYGAMPKYLVNENGEILAPLIREEEESVLPTATSGAIAAGYTAFGAHGMVEGSGKIVKNLIYGTTRTRFDSGNGRYYVDLFGINVSKISTVSAVANGTGSNGKSGLTITVKNDSNPLGYTVITLNTDDSVPIQAEFTINNGVMRLEAFGEQLTTIEYSILEEN